MQKILFFNWKDIKHPQAGGAEVVTHQIMEKLVKEENQVTLVTARYPKSREQDNINGVKVIRVGKNKFTHYPAAIWYYLKKLRGRFDLIVEEVNTIPYLLNFFKKKEKVVLFYHMLCKKIWFYEMPQPFSTLGYFLETLYTWVQSWFKNRTIVVSQSTKQDLLKHGFKEKNISIISEGIENKPLLDITKSFPKNPGFTVLIHGSLRSMKRPLEGFKAFNIFLNLLDNNQKKEISLWVSGSGDKSKLQAYALKKGFLGKVKFFGRTSEEKKLELMQKSHLLAVTSVKEGWGLIVTEANSMATPAVVYNVDGLRDACGFGNGFVVAPKPEALARQIFKLYKISKNEPDKYRKLRVKSLESSKKINFQNCYKDFRKALNV